MNNRELINYGDFKESEEIVFKKTNFLKYSLILGQSTNGLKGQLLFKKFSKNKLCPINTRSLDYGESFKISLDRESFENLKSEIYGFEELTKNSDLLKGKLTYTLTEENTMDFLEDFAKLENSKLILSKLKELSSDEIMNIESLLNLTRLKKIIKIWDKNKENSSESFWQELFSEHSWIFSQLFYFSSIICNNMTYVGGTGFKNNGGKLTDFIYQNNLTKNMCIIEIKTPTSKLSGKIYRGLNSKNKVFSVSDDFSGAINQLLDYKQKIFLNFINLKYNSENQDIELFNPKCLLIVGKISDFKDPSETKSFELFRSNLKDIEVITYDELFDKLKNIISNFGEVLEK